MKFSRTQAIAKKEVKQLSRDKRMLFVIFFFPALLLIVFGYAVNFDVQNIQIAIYDEDRSVESRDFINSTLSSQYFELVGYLDNSKNINRMLDEKLTQVVLIIPHNFSNKIHSSSEEAKLQFLIDGVDGNTAAIIKNYVNALTFNYNAKIQSQLLSRRGGKYFQPVEVEARFWFNPLVETTKFLIPGLIALILIVTAVVTVSLSLVREKERGTIEQINVSSLSTLELLTGKALPYILIALINAVLVIVAGYILFDVEIKGSAFLMLLSTLLFLAACISLGVFISVVSDSQQVAFTMGTFASLLPSLILSGFIFQIESMPFIIQIITNISPAKFYIAACRAIMLKGVGLEAYWEQWIYLIIFTFVLLFLASVINKRKLEIS